MVSVFISDAVPLLNAIESFESTSKTTLLLPASIDCDAISAELFFIGIALKYLKQWKKWNLIV